jgi:hypothetical protein
MMVRRGDRRRRPLEEVLVGLPARGPSARREVAREPPLDLVAGQPGELTGVALAQIRVDHHRTDADPVGDDHRRLGGASQVGRPDAVDGADGPGRLERLAPPEVGERWIGLALPPALGVPLGLAVADEQEAGRRGRVGAHGEGTVVRTLGGAHGEGTVVRTLGEATPATSGPGCGTARGRQ